ncbi:hypothetical protein ACFX2J_003166 [Malus domestica]
MAHIQTETKHRDMILAAKLQLKGYTPTIPSTHRRYLTRTTRIRQALPSNQSHRHQQTPSSRLLPRWRLLH